METEDCYRSNCDKTATRFWRFVDGSLCAYCSICTTDLHMEAISTANADSTVVELTKEEFEVVKVMEF